MTKHISALLLVFIFPVLFFAPRCLAQDKIIAIVNSEVITQKDLDNFTNFIRIQMSRDYKGNELEEQIQKLKPQFLDRLIEDRLVLQEAKKNDIRIDDGRVNARIEELRREYLSEQDFQKSLTEQGLVLADLQERIREQLLMMGIIDHAVRSKLVISPTEVTAYYEANAGQFRLPEQWEFRTLTIENEGLAKEIAERMKRGDTLETIAQQYSLTINRIRTYPSGQLREDIEKEVFKLKKGESARPLKIEGKYYIFRLDNIYPPQQQGLNEVQDKIYLFLENKKMEKAFIDWMKNIKQQSYIKILPG